MNDALKWRAARPFAQGTQGENDFVAATFVHETTYTTAFIHCEPENFFFFFFYTSSEMLRVITEGRGGGGEERWIFVGGRPVP